MSRFQAPRRLRDGAEIRAILEAVFEAVEGQVVAADACYERVYRSDAARLASGDRTLSGGSVKSGLVLRLIGEAGRHLEVSLGSLEPEAAADRARWSLSVLEGLAPQEDFRLAPLPDRSSRHFQPDAFEDPRQQDPVRAFWLLFDRVEQLAQKRSRRKRSLTPEISAFVQVEDKAIADLDGLWRTQTLPTCFVQVTWYAQRGGRKPRRARYCSRFGDIAGLEALISRRGQVTDPLQALLDQGADRALELLDARALDDAELAGLTHYILDPSAMVFVHEAQGHNFEADIIQRGDSGLFTRDGRPRAERLASPGVQLIDGPPPAPGGGCHRDRGFGTHYIDDEGVEVQPVVLIEQGRVAGQLHSRETAGRSGVIPNGRGFSELGDQRLVRMTNTYLTPSETGRIYPDERALLDGVELGVWLYDSTGGAVNRDGMSASIQYGRLIRHGRLTDEVLLPCNLVVRTALALQTVEGFFGAPRSDRPGFCGKGQGRAQRKPVTEGGPVTRIAANPGIRLTW